METPSEELAAATEGMDIKFYSAFTGLGPVGQYIHKRGERPS